MKYISLYIVLLLIGGCLNQNYYTQAEIIYIVDNIETDIKVNENQIEIDGYFENTGQGRNEGIKKIKVDIYYEDYGYLYSGSNISIKSDDSTNKTLNKISLGVDEKKNQKLVFKIDSSTENSIKNLTPTSISIDVYYY
ncbi:MAG: hypothetical protein ACQERZ_09165 [Fusobacteriota bacterium]